MSDTSQNTASEVSKSAQALLEETQGRIALEISDRNRLQAATSFRARLDRWLLGLAQATTQGGAMAIKAFFGCAGASVILPGVVPALDVKQASTVFLVGAGYHFFDYLVKNPLVPELETKN